MIKTILKITIMLCLLCHILTAQSQSYVGLRGGVNFANVPTTEDVFMTDERIAGIVVGLYYDIRINDKIALQPELGFVQKGFVTAPNNNLRKAYRLNYIDLDILCKYRLLNINNSSKKKKKINAYLLAGPYYGWAGSGKVKNRLQETKEPFNFSFLKHTDSGLIGGGGIELPMANRNTLIVDIRYNLGILHIDQWAPDGNIKNHGIHITVGYAFRQGQ